MSISRKCGNSDSGGREVAKDTWVDCGKCGNWRFLTGSPNGSGGGGDGGSGSEGEELPSRNGTNSERCDDNDDGSDNDNSTVGDGTMMA